MGTIMEKGRDAVVTTMSITVISMSINMRMVRRAAPMSMGMRKSINTLMFIHRVTDMIMAAAGMIMAAAGMIIMTMVIMRTVMMMVSTRSITIMRTAF